MEDCTLIEATTVVVVVVVVGGFVAKECQETRRQVSSSIVFNKSEYYCVSLSLTILLSLSLSLPLSLSLSLSISIYLSLQFIRECEARLVSDQMSYLLTYVPEMVHGERLDDLSNLFILFNEIPKALEPVKEEFKSRVTQQGLSLS